MGLHLGGDVTSMWWGGDVTEVHMGSVLVWRAIITVVPDPPVFHDGDPWVTLPDMEGVTYTVQGTTGYGQTVTVTASPLDGYELVGTASWTHTFGPEPLPVVTITGTSGSQSRDQFRQACVDYGTTYQTVEVLPFQLDTSQATNLSDMFRGCSSLTQVSNLDTSQATNMAMMFRGCSSLTSVSDLETSQATNLTYLFFDCASLTDGNVRCIGKHPNAATIFMITGSGLTREPFYHPDGTPWN